MQRCGQQLLRSKTMMQADHPCRRMRTLWQKGHNRRGLNQLGIGFQRSEREGIAEIAPGVAGLCANTDLVR